MGGGPYESSTAGQAMITYSHYSIFDTASPGRGKEARLPIFLNMPDMPLEGIWRGNRQV